MGSLIKSPGGTIAPGGGYVAGRADLVAAASARLTAPGVGLDAGCVEASTIRLHFQGASDQGILAIKVVWSLRAAVPHSSLTGADASRIQIMHYTPRPWHKLDTCLG